MRHWPSAGPPSGGWPADRTCDTRRPGDPGHVGLGEHAHCGDAAVGTHREHPPVSAHPAHGLTGLGGEPVDQPGHQQRQGEHCARAGYGDDELLEPEGEVRQGDGQHRRHDGIATVAMPPAFRTRSQASPVSEPWTRDMDRGASSTAEALFHRCRLRRRGHFSALPACVAVLSFDEGQIEGHGEGKAGEEAHHEEDPGDP